MSQSIFEKTTDLMWHSPSKTSIEELLFPRVTATGFATERAVASTLVVMDAQFVIQLANKVQEALDEVRQLREELSQRPLVSTITVYDLGTDTITIKVPISVVLQETDNETLARWPEPRAYGIGSTAAEAIAELKKNIVNSFLDLESRDPESLGEIALDTLRLFEIHLQVK